MKGTMMLMHGDTPVAECKFDVKGYLDSVPKIMDYKLLPVGVSEKNLKTDMQRWILKRGIAMARDDIKPYRDFYGSKIFVSDNVISLFDLYWFADIKDMDWNRYNAFDNWTGANDIVLSMLLTPDTVNVHMIEQIEQDGNNNSPNLTITGKEQRLWVKEKDGIYLLYGNAQKEMSTYRTAEEMNIMHPRKYIIKCGKIYVSTPIFTSKELELVSFEDIYTSCYSDELNKYDNLKKCCTKYDIPYWEKFIECVCKLDEETENDTRELADIGVLRDTKTLEYKGFALL